MSVDSDSDGTITLDSSVEILGSVSDHSDWGVELHRDANGIFIFPDSDGTMMLDSSVENLDSDSDGNFTFDSHDELRIRPPNISPIPFRNVSSDEDTIQRPSSVRDVGIPAAINSSFELMTHRPDESMSELYGAGSSAGRFDHRSTRFDGRRIDNPSNSTSTPAPSDTMTILKNASRHYPSEIAARMTPQDAMKRVPPKPYELPSNTALKIKIRRYVSVAEWKWKKQTTDAHCGICLQIFEACCVDCSYPGNCPLEEGHCRHSFHAHCISKWLHSNGGGLCPLCRQDWLPVFPMRMHR